MAEKMQAEAHAGPGDHAPAATRAPTSPPPSSSRSPAPKRRGRPSCATPGPDLDPQLVWKGKDEQDGHDLEVPAVPIYIQETIDPLALVEELRAESEGRQTEQQLGFFGPYTRPHVRGEGRLLPPRRASGRTG